MTDTPITLWAVMDPNGRLLTHTIADCRAQAVETFRYGAYPRTRIEHWWAKGYKVVAIEVRVKQEHEAKRWES